MAPGFVAYWINNGQRWISARVGYDANDPSRTSGLVVLNDERLKILVACDTSVVALAN
jgi:hypothetical protein